MNAPTVPPDLSPDVAELDAIAVQARPIADAGKARALAFEIVRLMLVAFKPPQHGPLFDSPTLTMRLFRALDSWFTAALDIDRGEVVQMFPGGPRLDLHDVRRMADLIASRAWARTRLPVPIENWIVYDIATALDRACQCDDAKEIKIDHLKFVGAGRDIVEAHNFTARTLLPLIIRDARRLCAAAHVNADAIEAAIAAHGGTPS